MLPLCVPVNDGSLRCHVIVFSAESNSSTSKTIPFLCCLEMLLWDMIII